MVAIFFKNNVLSRISSRFLRVGILSTLVVALVGCTSLAERRIETARLAHVAGAESMYGSFLRSDCRSEYCVSYIELAGLEFENGEPLSSFRMARTINGELSEILYEFQPLADDAPVMVMFPGHGMTKELLAFHGFMFRSLGIEVLVVAGPTEQRPFSMGANGARQMAAVLAEDYADRTLLGFGFSMGAVGVSLLNESLADNGQTLAGAILLAPMVDFNESAEAAFQLIRRDSLAARLLPQRSASQAINRISDRQQGVLQSYQVARPRLPTDSLIIAGDKDTVVNSAQIIAHFGELHDVQVLEDYNHVRLIAGEPEVNALMQEWLENRFVLTVTSALSVTSEEETNE
ncbi:MAG: alpha/beta hydrolase [Idiomarina sp.]|nr:alpha/beta hydrolase [Idiomarina sp.]